MKLLTATLLLSLIGSSVLCDTELTTSPDSLFDGYGGDIRWNDEMSRLDNFAITLQNDEKLVGYILVYDETGGCPGEATARAMRAKRYLTEYRGIPWNRVIWRRDGYDNDVRTTLLLAPREVIFPIPFSDTRVPAVDGPETRACRAMLKRIRTSRFSVSPLR